jgi:hypothetical protein
VWTSREVRFMPFPSERFDEDAVLDALCDHYWSRPVRVRRFVEPTICGSAGLGSLVAGLPWWMPAWRARRSVVGIMTRLELAGVATCCTVRTALTI